MQGAYLSHGDLKQHAAHPNFVIVGAPRTGTTSIFHFLNKMAVYLTACLKISLENIIRPTKVELVLWVVISKMIKNKNRKKSTGSKRQFAKNPTFLKRKKLEEEIATLKDLYSQVAFNAPTLNDNKGTWILHSRQTAVKWNIFAVRQQLNTFIQCTHKCVLYTSLFDYVLCRKQCGTSKYGVVLLKPQLCVFLRR